MSGMSGEGVLSIFRLLFASIGRAESPVQLDFEQVLTGIGGSNLGVDQREPTCSGGGVSQLPAGSGFERSTR